jgi:hypothetical protein
VQSVRGVALLPEELGGSHKRYLASPSGASLAHRPRFPGLGTVEHGTTIVEVGRNRQARLAPCLRLPCIKVSSHIGLLSSQ